MSLLIKNGTIVDPATKQVLKSDVLIEDGYIREIKENIKDHSGEIIDAKGCYIMPGFIDLHVHLREPGLEYKETIETGAKAGAHGGYTTICAMPNTKPVIDNKDRVNFVHYKAKDVAPIHVLQIGAVTKGQNGEEVADIEEMAEAGIPAISEDGKSVMNLKVYEEAMKRAAAIDLPVFAHCEDKNLVAGGVMNAGKKAEELHLPGISNAVEDVIMARDLIMGRETGVRVHFCHCSTAFSVEIMKNAKARGDKVTAEVCPHHFAMCDEDIVSDDGMYKMNPPLRSKADVEALKKGLKEDIMDVIATDHAPHHKSEKYGSMTKTAFGIVGLETAAALTYTELVEKGYLTILQMAEKMSYNPAKIIGLDKGKITKGSVADLVIFDPDTEYRIDVNTFASKGKNTPFDGKKVKGLVRATICDGKVVYRWEEKND